MKNVTTSELIEKYDIPVPRYTSYPTVPYWNTEHFTETNWWDAVLSCYNESNNTKGLSLYIHLPFCESLCTYCACNTRITKNHRVEEQYIKAVLSEWEMYKNRFSSTPRISELHLGGGTPTFFSASNLENLLHGIFKGVKLCETPEFSFEGHPNNTKEDHLKTLYAHGFRRVSFGVQDLDPVVQHAINRQQPFEHVERVIYNSRTIGYTSVNVDLVYGLPYQTENTVKSTISRVIDLKPDRIAFYSYAHVPWIKPGQRGYEDANLPTNIVKRKLYETGKELFLNAGYVDIGMDHFSLTSDSLHNAKKAGTLHRNFMGYTTSQTNLLIGLGVSAISDAHYGYAQNEKQVEAYEGRILRGESAIFKGHIQTEIDRTIRSCITQIACNGKLSGELVSKIIAEVDDCSIINNMRDDGLLTLSESGLQITEKGWPFVRTICSVFDLRMRASSQKSTSIFSKAI